ncbi:MAG: hypothetical protein EOR08_06945 [Mesorhizobium sp.]|nr:MAG: hypothetical protein EOR08_06945 [Mesorhizobium sp.]
MRAAATSFPYSLLPYCPTALLPYCLTPLLPYCLTMADGRHRVRRGHRAEWSLAAASLRSTRATFGPCGKHPERGLAGRRKR